MISMEVMILYGGLVQEQAPNDILGCALDIDNNRVTFSKGGQWCDGSGNWDEANPTAWLTLTADKTYFFAAGDNSTSTNAEWEFNFGNGLFGTTSVSSAQNPSVGNTDAIFEYTVPTGFTALSTKGMNSFQEDIWHLQQLIKVQIILVQISIQGMAHHQEL